MTLRYYLTSTSLLTYVRGQPLRQLWLRALSLLAWALMLVVLCCTCWAAWQMITLPYIGFDFLGEHGIVTAVDGAGPAADVLQVGDRLLATDGTPGVAALRNGRLRVGDMLYLRVRRDGIERSFSISLAAPSLSMILLREVPVLVALAFWGLGGIVSLMRRLYGHGWFFWLFCQSLAAALAAAAWATYGGPVWTVRLYHALIWWIGPFIVHFHWCSSPLAARRSVIRLMLFSYLLAGIGSALELLGSSVLPSAAMALLFDMSLLWFALCLSALPPLLLWAVRQTISPDASRRLRRVLLGSALAVLPFCAFFLVPFALLGRSLLPVEIAFLFLLLLSGIYGYALLTRQILQIDRYVSRVAVFALVLVLLSGIFLILNAALVDLLPAGLWRQPLINMAIALGMAGLAIPLYRYLKMSIHRMCYGGWYDYRSVIQQMSQTLNSSTSRAALAQMLVQTLRETMQLEWVYLLLPDAGGDLALAESACAPFADTPSHLARLAREAPLYQHLQRHQHPLASQAMRHVLAGAPLSDPERRFLAAGPQGLLLPIGGVEGGLLGLLVLGRKYGYEHFDAEDLTMLQVVAQQVGVVIQNIQLVAELQRHHQEHTQYHHQAMRAREGERKAIARELHDQVIQDLVGTNYHLSALRAHPDPEIARCVAEVQGDIRRLLDEVRRICADLRPPALDSLGLVPAIRAYLREMMAQCPVQIALVIVGDAERRLPEDVELCLFRVIQEVLSNVRKHAAARHVDVRLTIADDQVCLIVQDDGVGFYVPQHLGALLNNHHFGLIGVRERMELVQGEIEILSAPGRGTRVRGCVPLPPNLFLGKEDKADV